MTENKSYLQKYAMHFGTYMGIYWILKFILFPLGFYVPFFFFLFSMLTLAVPFIGYYYTTMYRDKVCNGNISFSHGVLFGIFMYLFASLLTALPHYIYFQFINHSFIIQAPLQYWEKLMADAPAMAQYKEMITELTDNIRSLTPIDLTMRNLSQNVFVGSLLSIPTALMVMKESNPDSGPTIQP